jgi:DNA-binding MarR family transcriptional regulator
LPEPPGESALTAEANLLGALAMLIADQTTGAVAEIAGSSSAASALSALAQFLDRPTIDDLHRVLGLTPSGAVRLVDRLVEAGLVARGPGDDGRSRSVRLTPAGRRAAARVASARAAVLKASLNDLTATERRGLHRLLGRVAAGLVWRKEGGAWICRMCDLRSCGREEGRCPVANAAVTKYGAPSGAAAT